jgi:Xaa-Pro aminopeptidase
MSVTGVDDPADADLRAARRQRVFDAMDAAGLDALVLGRRDSVAYATGVRSLWTAGTRLFGPACVLVAARRSVHLLSTWDEGVPPEVPFEHLYGVTWNPAVMAGSLAAVPGLPEARRIGVDGLSVGFASAAGRLAPGASLVPADDVLQAVRAVKLPAEVERMRVAVAVATAGVGVASAALATGASPSEALADTLAAVGTAGVTVPTSAPLVEPVGEAASLVRVDLGFLVDGYEGGRGRTVPAGGSGDPRLDTVREAQRRLIDACRPGASGTDLQATAAGPGAAGAAGWLVRGSGMGFEAPVVTDALGGSAVLAENMVLSVEASIDGVVRRDLVLVTPAGGQPL